ncbi:MAG TPA: TRAP transporter small permease, partial [Bacillota bacterium]|nr:TRAP transporter small permease [Bacillota bacterium]
MNAELPPTAEIPVSHAAPVTGWRGWFRNGENLVISLTLAAMVLLPLSEILLRKLFHTGISGVNAFLQHGTLIIGLLGGAVAAREGRLLSLSTLAGLLKGRWQLIARVYSSMVAITITVFLCVASYQFVMSEKEGGKILAYNIPTWLVQFVMPIGFAAIALRILWHVSTQWVPRL